MKFCTNCGSKLEEGAKVCHVCGQQLEGPVSTSEPENLQQAKSVSEPSPGESMDSTEQPVAEELKEEPLWPGTPSQDAETVPTDQANYTQSQYQAVPGPEMQANNNTFNADNTYPNPGSFNYGNAYNGPVNPTTGQAPKPYPQAQNQPQSPQANFGQNQGSYQPYNAGAPSYQYTGPQDKASTMALISMILGIVGLLVCCFIPFVSIVTGIVGLILGIIGIKQSSEKKGMAIAGIILNALSLILGIVTVILLLTLGDSLVDIVRQSGYSY